ncbi:STE family protein kinase [Histomonas meleagridis]|uniref:STE family protein kinase n=1 Tax=Histomonas meleagridis TaxID=135588 RepID=UPI00355A4118|nr:STE family protein kinase [Histomonas meleagridis]KAH0798029.1 STE family protein kinase [Histomonas meleagridis]
MFKRFLKRFGTKPSEITLGISGPLEVRHEVHVDKDLNWSFDESVDPLTIFSKLKVIGQGGFGTVSTILHRPSMKVLAGKIINPTLVTENSKQELQHEIQLMREVDSKYTVRYYGSVPFEGSLMILMEYCNKGSLRDILDAREKVLSEDQISIVMSDLLHGMQLIHNKFHIIHRDIKAANLLLTANGEIKIADFGVSRQFDSNGKNTVTIVGTPYWMAPEVICGIPYSYPADVWSIGMTAVELSEGAPPYVEFPPTKAMIDIATKGFPGYRFPDLHSEEFTDFVSHCAIKDQNSRWTIEQLLEHPFIKRAERLDRQETMAELLQKIEKPEKEAPKEEPQTQSSTFIVSTKGTSTFAPADSELLKSNTPIYDKNDTFSDFDNPMLPQSPTDSLAIGTDTFKPSFDVTQTGEQQFVVTFSQPKTETIEPQTEKKEIDDKTFVQMSKQMSTKMPFTPMTFGSNPEAPIKTLYTTFVIEKDSNVLPPLFDEDGVISFETAFRHPKAPRFIAVFLAFLVYLFFGADGFVVLLALAFLTQMVITMSEKRDQKKQSLLDNFNEQNNNNHEDNRQQQGVDQPKAAA